MHLVFDVNEQQALLPHPIIKLFESKILNVLTSVFYQPIRPKSQN